MITLHKLAEIVGGKVIGAPEKIIIGVSDIKQSAPDTITFLFNPKHKELLDTTKASAIVVSEETLLSKHNGIVVDNPRLAMAKILGVFEEKNSNNGIHPTALIAESVTLGKNVNIGGHTVVGENVSIADNVFIHNNVSIGEDVEIGRGSEIFPQVAIHSNVKIGKQVTIDMGTIIGSRGFGYETVDDLHHTIPQIGSVIIEDQVDIGANCTIDRGTIRNTTIGHGTKIDNLVHVAHNVKIGKGCLIAGQTGIAGGAKIGDYCVFAGHVGVKDGITIGDRAIFLAKTGVSKSVPGGKVYSGMPCREARETNKRDAAYSQIQALKRRQKALEDKLAK